MESYGEPRMAELLNEFWESADVTYLRAILDVPRVWYRYRIAEHGGGDHEQGKFRMDLMEAIATQLSQLPLVHRVSVAPNPLYSLNSFS